MNILLMGDIRDILCIGKPRRKWEYSNHYIYLVFALIYQVIKKIFIKKLISKINIEKWL